MTAMLARLAGSVVAVAALALIAWRLGLGEPRPIGNAQAAMRAAEDALPGFRATGAAIGDDGRAALVAGEDGRLAVLKQHGTHLAAREVTAAALAPASRGTWVDPGDRRFGRVLVAGVGRAAAERLAPSLTMV